MDQQLLFLENSTMLLLHFHTIQYHSKTQQNQLSKNNIYMIYIYFEEILLPSELSEKEEECPRTSKTRTKRVTNAV